MSPKIKIELENQWDDGAAESMSRSPPIEISTARIAGEQERFGGFPERSRVTDNMVRAGFTGYAALRACRDCFARRLLQLVA